MLADLRCGSNAKIRVDRLKKKERTCERVVIESQNTYLHIYQTVDTNDCNERKVKQSPRSKGSYKEKGKVKAKHGSH